MEKLKMICIALLLTVCIIKISAQDDILKTKISVNISNGHITEVIERISEKHNIFFSYDTEIFESEERKDYSYNDKTLEEVLGHVLDEAIGYKIINNQVILYKKSNSDKKIKKQTIRGRVIDKDTKTPITGATIVIPNSNPMRGTISDHGGYYEIKDVQVGRQNLQVSFIGYKTVTLDNVLLLSAKEKILNVELEESVEEIEEVVIQAYLRKDDALNSMATAGARSFTIEETEKFAGSWGDPSRMASNYAGVLMVNDENNDIIIRGNSPIGLIWQLEGSPIPSPNHFDNLGANGGPISILNNNTLSRSDFFTGAFPAEYGNGYSGVFDLQMRNGDNENYEFILQSSFAGYEIGAEGPIFRKNKSSFIANYRYSMLGLVDDLLWIGELPHYQDVSYKVNIPYSKGNVSLFGFGGTSYIIFSSKNVGRDSEEQWDVDEKTASNTWFSGIKNTHFLTPGIRMENSISYAVRNPSGEMNFLTDGVSKWNVVEEDDNEQKYTYSFKLFSKINRKNFVVSGFSLENTHIHTSNYDYDIENDTILSNKLFEYERNDIYTLNHFIDYQHKFTDNLILNAGAHYLHFFLNNTYSIEPRIGLKYQYSARGKVGLVYGNHCQVQPHIYYLLIEGTDNNYNKNLDFTKSHQYVLAHDYSINTNLRLKAELYYQDLYDVPVHLSDGIFSLINHGVSDQEEFTWSDSLINKGTGENYGIDVTFERFLSDGYYFLFTTSLFNSTYKGSDGKKRNTRYNGNYVFNALGGYEFKIGKNSLMDFNIRCVYAGGMPIIPIDKDRSIELGHPYYLNERGYEDRLNNYFRLDFRTGFVIQRRWTHEIAFEITNLTNHKNEYARLYDEGKQDIITEYQQGFFPMGLYRLSF